MSKKVIHGKKARKLLLKGAKKLAKTVGNTMGPMGRNVLIQRQYNKPHFTKDGVTVANDISLPNVVENLAVQHIQSVADNAVKETGDGTTTATILAYHIFKEGVKHVDNGASPIEIKRGMDKSLIKVSEYLKDISIPVDDTKILTQIATLSANTDTTIGELVSEAVTSVDKDGSVTVEEHKGINDVLEISEGITYNKGYKSEYFINNSNKMLCELNNPLIYLTSKKIKDISEISEATKIAIQHNRPIMFITDGMTDKVLHTLIDAKINNGLQVIVTDVPGWSNRKKEWLTDIAVISGGKIIENTIKGVTADISLDTLGSIDKVVVSRLKTILIGRHGTKEGIDNHVSQLRVLLEDKDVTEYDIKVLQERIAKLKGGVATIKVGGKTEAESKERKDRVDDALGAVQASREEGIVVGGGTALARASINVDISDLKGDEKIGGEILLKAILAPMKQIIKNAYKKPSIIIDKVLTNDDVLYGYNVKNDEYVDMIREGIIDPCKVTRVALENAVSIASLLLTTESIITDTYTANTNNVYSQPQV